MIFLFFLSYIQKASIVLYYYSDWPEISYGFNKNADVSIKFANLSSVIIFGLATKDEIKNIEKIDYPLEKFGESVGKLSNIQFFVKNDTILNFQTQSKSILTPYAISNVSQYFFNMEINILNGKNHLDYRYQSSMVSSMVFIILFFVFGLIFLIFIIIGAVKGTKIRIKISIFLMIFSILIGIQSIFSYSLISTNKNNEYISNIIENGKNVGYIIFGTFSLVLIYIFLYFLYVNFSFKGLVYCPLFIFSILGFIVIILPSFITYLTAFLLSLPFYFLYIIFATLIHIRFSLTRIAILFYFGESFFTLICRNFTFKRDFKIINLCQKFTVLTLVSNILHSITLILLLIDLVNPHTFYYMKIIDNEDDLSENEFLDINENPEDGLLEINNKK